jgi:hypothetical protein
VAGVLMGAYLESKLLENLDRLAGAGFDVTLGARKAPSATGVYVTLEHLRLDEPREFGAEGRAGFAEAVAFACGWASAAGYELAAPGSGELAELPDVAKVERLSLKPGDRLVLSVDHCLSDEEYHEITGRMDEWARAAGLPEGGFLILEAGQSLQVLEAGT